MYIVDLFTGPKAIEIAVAPTPFGAGFDTKQIENIHSLTVMGTSFNDPGPDYCEFIVKDNQDRVIITRKIPNF